ncbi:major facilitator superfamily domain-containing protein [Mycena rosella]|uniref:Major facilitator superfamily domain-containing protein n=1 Tax=Mycena rosella TaxID=1033263 RepID=A0AAD7DXU7_MYCRO|nr:major facilitator superfamily domain-containing protein [Mycena rosella]
MQSAHPESQERTLESTPLLVDYGLLEARRPTKTPLPKALAAVCISRLTDPIAYTQIFPYINEFLILLHVTDDVSKIGFYSGLVESAFAISQTLTIYYWAKLSDVIGRRPIILACALGLALVTVLFGLCTSLTQILFVRMLAGFFAGNVAVYHTVLAELTDTTNSPVAYSLYAFTWPFGATIGPLIGGSLSNLGTKYSQYFGYEFILAYPYFMPNLVCAVLVMVGVSLSYLFLEETLPSKRRGRSRSLCVDSVNQQSSPLGAMDLLAIPMMRALAASGFTMAFISTSFDVVFVLFCYTPVSKGGLSFSARPPQIWREIGYALAMSGVILAIFQLFLMPTLLRKYNAAKMYNFCMRIWPLTFFLIPLLNSIVRGGYDSERAIVAPTTKALLWIGIAVVLTCSRIATLAFAINMILVRNHAPSVSSLGAANGLVQAAMCVSRCFSPAFISSVFALSVGNNLLGGYPIWVLVMLMVCLLGCFLSQKMVAIDEKEKVLS